MTTTTYNSEAVVVLPAARHGAVRAGELRRWLARSDLDVSEEPDEILSRVTRALGQPAIDAGCGALRLWGQTGDRPTVWIAAADPVYLEPRLDHLSLHRLSAEEVPPDDLGQLFDELQQELGSDAGFGFVHLGRYGYLRGAEPIPTATRSAEALNGREPTAFMPAGPASRSFHRIHSEIQMQLHLSDVHRRRERVGARPINALWLWGGGAAPPVAARAIPPLYGDDPLLRGYWRSACGSVDRWGGRLEDCAEQSPDGFVAVVPHVLEPSADGMDALSAHLDALRRILRHSDIRSLRLLFRDGVTALVRRRHGLRVWRAPAAYLEPRNTL